MGKSNSKLKEMEEFEPEVHRVLGTKFTPPFPEGTEFCIVGCGCYWGAEKIFWRMPGVYTTASGFAKDKKSKRPRDFIEAVLVVFDKKSLSVSDIIRMFLQCHDPTQSGGQGNDEGKAYRSAFFYNTTEQKLIIEAAIQEYEKLLKGKKIATDIMKGDLNDFAYASDEQQQYLASSGARGYSSVRPLGVNLTANGIWLPDSLKESYTPKLSESFWKKHSPYFQKVLKDPQEQIKS